MDISTETILHEICSSPNAHEKPPLQLLREYIAVHVSPAQRDEFLENMSAQAIRLQLIRHSLTSPMHGSPSSIPPPSNNFLQLPQTTQPALSRSNSVVSNMGGTGSGSPSGNPKQRLIAFYSFYAKEKLKNVDDVLTKYAGRIDELFVELVKRYGPEPYTAHGPLVIQTVKSPETCIGALATKLGDTGTFAACGEALNISTDKRSVTKPMGEARLWNAGAVIDLPLTKSKQTSWTMRVSLSTSAVQNGSLAGGGNSNNPASVNSSSDQQFGMEEIPSVLVGVADSGLPLSGDRNFFSYNNCAFIDIFDGSCYARGRPRPPAFRRDLMVTLRSTFHFVYDPSTKLLQCHVDNHEFSVIVIGFESVTTLYPVVEINTPGVTVELLK